MSLPEDCPVSDDPPGTTRRVLLPDLNGDLTAALNRAEELLLTVRAWAGDPAVDGLGLPGVLAGGQALEAVRRLAAVVRVAEDSAVRILAPNGRYEHAPLALVEVEEQDLAALRETARFFQAALDPQSRRSWREEIVWLVEDSLASTHHADPHSGVDELVRLHRLLDLPWDPHCAEIARADIECRHQ